MIDIYKYISIDPAIANGEPVFAGSDIPVKDLLLHIEKEQAIEDFIEDHPALSKEQVMAVVEFTMQAINSVKKKEE